MAVDAGVRVIATTRGRERVALLEKLGAERVETARASLPSLELKIGVRGERPCARDAAICRILQGGVDEVSNT